MMLAKRQMTSKSDADTHSPNLNTGVKTQNSQAKPNSLAKWFRRRILKNFFSAIRWIVRAIPRVWAWIVSVLHFLSLLEDAEAGQPRRLSQVRVMIWGAMVVGALLIGKVQITGDPITWTEGGFASLLTVVAGLMKYRRDQQDERDGRGRWSGRGYDGQSDFGDDPIDPFSDPE